MNNWDQSAFIHPSTRFVAVIVADSSSVAVSWDSSNILLLSGDVKSNPGPRCPDENPTYCIISSAKIKRGIQQDTAPSCTETNRQSQCHQAFANANITQPPAPINTTPSQQLPTQSWDKLTIIQWNADGIRLKMLELRDKLINWDIGIVVIQESKLWKTNKTPFIEGYATIRKDETAFLAMVSYSLSAMRWFSKSYNLSKKQAWKS